MKMRLEKVNTLVSHNFLIGGKVNYFLIGYFTCTERESCQSLYFCDGRKQSLSLSATMAKY